jgi:hypothetical protein
MMDCSLWLESVLEWDLKDYYNLFREFLTASGNGIAVPNQHTMEFAFPVVIGEYKEKTVSCHPWHGVPDFLHPMLPTHEVKLISTLLECLGKEFMMDLDITPVMSRELRVAEFITNPTTIPAIIIRRSNGDRLGAAFRDMGVSTIYLEFSGRIVNSASVEAFLPTLKKQLETTDSTIPIILYMLDNMCFRSVNAEGDLVAINRDKEDRKFHVIGDLAVTPYSLLSNVMLAMDSIIAACGRRTVYIMSVLPRYMLNSCCDDENHCCNVRSADGAAMEETVKLLDELQELNNKISRRLVRSNVNWMAASDYLSGKDDCPSSTLLDALYSCWANDPVHGDKIAYTKLAMGALTTINGRQHGSGAAGGDGAGPSGYTAGNPRKRSREDSPPNSYSRGRYGYDESRPVRGGWGQYGGGGSGYGSARSYGGSGGGRLDRRDFSRR